MTDSAEPAQRGALLRRLLDVMRNLFTPLAVLFLVAAAYQSRGAFAEAVSHARLAPLVVATLLWSLLHLLIPAIAASVLRGLGASVGFRQALAIHLARLPARYLPGGIWQTVSRMVDLRALSVDRGRLTVLVAVENVGPLATGLVVGGICAGFAPQMRLPWVLIVAVGTVLALALPYALRRLLPATPLPATSYLRALAVSVVFWIGAGASFAAYWSAFDRVVPTPPFPELFATYQLSWAAGFVAVFAPQGLGVFEAVAATMLRGAARLPEIVMLVAGFRATTLAADALAYVAGRVAAHTTRARRRSH